MRVLRIALFALLAACSASAAWAQYGLYGSPDVLPMPQQNAVADNQAYQPYQPGAQYQYPNPSYPLPARTAVAERPAAGPAMSLTSDAVAGQVPAPPAPGNGLTPQGQGGLSRVGEPSCYGGCSGPYSSAMNRFDQAACGSCSGGCGCGGYCGGDNCCSWYGDVCALVMGRSDARRIWTSNVPFPHEEIQLANTQFSMPWTWGGEVTVGHRFCCGCAAWAVEATYWSTVESSNSQTTTYPGGVSTPLVIQPMTFGDGGESAEDWFDGAKEHRLWRQDEFQNVEINLLRQQLSCCCGTPWDASWLLGLRYFRFHEALTFGSLRQGYDWGDNNGAGEAYLSDNITNNLFGVQIGFQAGYRLTCGVRLFIEPKIGIYDNYLDGTFQAHTGDGINGYGPYGPFPVHSTRNGVSFLSQIDLGAEWRLTHNLSLAPATA